MDILSLAEPALVVQAGDTVSKVAAAMCGKKRHEALVFEGKEFLGMLSARELAKKSIDNPEKAKVSGLRALIRKVTPFPPEAEARELVSFLLASGCSSVPVRSRAAYYTVPKLSLLATLDKGALRRMKASDVMAFPQSLSPDDPLSVAQSLFREADATRLAVINRSGRADGIIDALDLLRKDIGRTRPRRGEVAGERLRLKEVLASSFMQKTLLTVSPDEPLAGILKRMADARSQTVVVQDDKFRGIITPTSILRLARTEAPGISVTVSGQQKEDTFIMSVVDGQIRNEARKLGRLARIRDLSLHIDRYKEEGTGKRVKYSVKGKLVADKGMFFSKDHAWDLTQAVRGVLAKLERELMKKIGKQRHRSF